MPGVGAGFNAEGMIGEGEFPHFDTQGFALEPWKASQRRRARVAVNTFDSETTDGELL